MSDKTNAQRAIEYAGDAVRDYAAGGPAVLAPAIAQVYATLALVDQLADLEDAVRGLRPTFAGPFRPPSVTGPKKSTPAGDA
jgi:hypothetical protein